MTENTINWLNGSAKTTRLNRIIWGENKRKRLKTVVEASAGPMNERNRLQSEKRNSEAEEQKISKESAEIAKLLEEEVKFLNEIETKGKDAWLKFNKYNFIGKLNDWLVNLIDKGYDNRYAVNYGGKTTYVNESLGAERIAYEIAYQIAKIDAEDFEAKLNNDSNFNSETKEKLVSLLKQIKEYTKNLDEFSETKQGVQFVYHEFASKPYQFDFSKFFEFVHLFAPADEEITTKAFINKLENKNEWSGEKKWYLWGTSNEMLSQKRRSELVDNKMVPPSFGDANAKIYWSDEKNSRIIDIEAGLYGWIKLYYATFIEEEARNKVKESAGKLNGAVINITNEFIGEYHDKKFRENYSFDSEVKKDEDGQFIKVLMLESPESMKETTVKKKAKLEAKLGLNEKKLINQYNKSEQFKTKIRDEKSKIVSKDKDVQKIVDELIAEKKALIDKTNFQDPNFDWESTENILKAAAVAQALIDIRFLENDGDDNKPFKDAKHQQILDKINEEKGAGWIAIIKERWERAGKDTAERIKAIKAGAANDGISLEIFKNVYEQAGDTEIVEAINEALSSEIPSPEEELTKEGLNEALKITDATDEMVNKWKAESSELDKEEIGKLINEVAETEDKKNNFITHLKKTDANATWEAFVKQEPKNVIDKIIEHLLENNDYKEAAKTRMKAWNPTVDNKKKKLADSYFDANGIATEAGIKQFLYEEKAFKGHAMKDDTATGTETPPEKPWWDWGTPSGKALWIVVGVLLIAGLSALIFWEQLSNWWNGPADEEGKSEGEEENE